MIVIKLSKPKLKRINISKFFWKAVKGYKMLRASGRWMPRGMVPGGRFPYPMPLGGLEIKGPSIKISEIKAEKFIIGEEEPKGIPIITTGFEDIGKISGPEIDLKNIDISYNLI